MNRAEVHTALSSLALPDGEWVVHSSAVMLLHGLIPNAGDLDLIARGPAWDLALRLGEPVAGSEDLCVRLGGNVEIWSGWLGQDIDALIGGAELVDGVPCVTLSEVLRFKLSMSRPKDRPHIALLRERLRLGE